MAGTIDGVEQDWRGRRIEILLVVWGFLKVPFQSPA
jgi:hypothetical protein